SLLCIPFFFSSRRRHTRFSRDWSSDVCSSDLLLEHRGAVAGRGPVVVQRGALAGQRGGGPGGGLRVPAGAGEQLLGGGGPDGGEIGRAACRERGQGPVAGGAVVAQGVRKRRRG